MGSWNSTCALTHLPIVCNERVVIVPIIQKFEGDCAGGGMVEPTDVFAPFCLPIHGAYDDYGGINRVQPDDYLLSVINSATGKQAVSFEEFVYFIERGNIPHLNYVMFLEEPYHITIGNIANRIPYKQKSTFRELLSKEADRFFDIYEAFGCKNKLEELGNYCAKVDDNHFYNTIRYSYDSYTYPNAIYECLQRRYKEQLIDLILLERAFHFGRYAWYPQAGSGSQYNEYDLHAALAQYVIDDVRKRKEETAQDGEEQFFKTTIFW